MNYYKLRTDLSAISSKASKMQAKKLKVSRFGVIFATGTKHTVASTRGVDTMIISVVLQVQLAISHTTQNTAVI